MACIAHTFLSDQTDRKDQSNSKLKIEAGRRSATLRDRVSLFSF